MAEKTQKNKEASDGGRNAAATKERILEAAKVLFSQDVYKNVGTRDIAALAGVNITLINRYFGSKKGLFKAVVMSSWQTPAPQEAPKEQAFQAIIEFLSEPSSPRKQAIRLMLMSIMDSQVSDIICDFTLKRLKVQADVIPGNNKEAKAALIFAAVAGASIIFPLIQGKAVNSDSDTAYSKQYFTTMLEYLFSETEPQSKG